MAPICSFKLERIGAHTVPRFTLLTLAQMCGSVILLVGSDRGWDRKASAVESVLDTPVTYPTLVGPTEQG